MTFLTGEWAADILFASFMASSGTYYRFAFRAMADISGTILVPAVVALLVGKWLDARLAVQGFAMYAILGLTFVGTAFVLVKKIRAYGQAYRQLLDSEPPRHGAPRG
ncbi:MAG: hypothetical protein UY72_C0016G0009 [Candidatus Uhrbacteria bacterium GW2011_GWD2_52_7]|uniref:Uncharacterized protein n=1 Tax=Candidatus Uhrbacteria bacterium GW2011_GWD2_52_7 TaxID=1618989 RepID=A0A0G1XH46_9BACT|nr:MAG: hypothetical protein UY72_C0016G0009 [Candidatus Uhrbacteria bacterium GW2011_GWD2_52_7]